MSRGLQPYVLVLMTVNPTQSAARTTSDRAVRLLSICSRGALLGFRTPYANIHPAGCHLLSTFNGVEAHRNGIRRRICRPRRRRFCRLCSWYGFPGRWICTSDLLHCESFSKRFSCLLEDRRHLLQQFRQTSILLRLQLSQHTFKAEV